MIALLTLLGCASGLRRADRLYDAGAYGEAVAAYEEVLRDDAAERELDRVLLRLAVLYAWPASPVHDEERARALYGELTRRFAAGPYGAQAARVFDYEATIEDYEAAREDFEATEALLREEAERLRKESGRLGEEAARLRREVAACRDQLEKLKAIDAGGSPP